MSLKNIGNFIRRMLAAAAAAMILYIPAIAQDNTVNQKSTDELLRELIDNPDNPTMLMFTASWCAPCHKMRNVTFKDDSVSPLLKKYNIVMLDIDTPFGLDMQNKYCEDRSVPTFILLNKNLDVIATQKGATDVPSDFASFLSIGLPKAAQEKLEDATSQEKLDKVTGEDFHEAAAATLSEDLVRNRWIIGPEAGIGIADIKHFPDHTGFNWFGGVFARCTNYKHNAFETGIRYTPLQGFCIPIEYSFRLFGGFNLGGGALISSHFGLDPRRKDYLSSSDAEVAATVFKKFDFGFEAVASYQINDLRFGVRASYGVVNQIPNSLLDKAHNKMLSVFVAYDLFKF